MSSLNPWNRVEPVEGRLWEPPSGSSEPSSQWPGNENDLPERWGEMGIEDGVKMEKQDVHQFMDRLGADPGYIIQGGHKMDLEGNTLSTWHISDGCHVYKIRLRDVFDPESGYGEKVKLDCIGPCPPEKQSDMVHNHERGFDAVIEYVTLQGDGAAVDYEIGEGFVYWEEEQDEQEQQEFYDSDVAEEAIENAPEKHPFYRN